ncbi:undecaprenyl-diphosphate phosphatase [Virgibacillus soli]|uniref:Undecaprenyl-diphosphatase n=1 Tax=Paracerasibacillus soli TaxID=480284 RepID=A0ABU5CQY4_9BACI|nr:undecaprenyl-diphosphate phosphatase [Virgibacillus soli]MDY0407875.1 undecaprenyl-diphosphate phosphatase [Virgibacillus soli]
MADLWTIMKYLILGLIQGVTEPIPISSSGHLVIFRDLFNVMIEGLSFEILVNFGSLIAVFVIYRHDIFRLLKGSFAFITWKKQKNRQDFIFMIYLIVATIPAGVIGLLLKDKIGENSTATMVGYTLLVTGLALWIIRNLRGRKQDGDLTFKDAIIVGLAQATALIPGISRSGATIVAAMLLGMKQDTALRFSFLLYIPISLGVTILSIEDIVQDPNFEFIPNAVAFIASIIASYFALKWFMNIMRKGNLKYFSFYCFIVGILVIIFM